MLTIVLIKCFSGSHRQRNQVMTEKLLHSKSYRDNDVVKASLSLRSHLPRYLITLNWGNSVHRQQGCPSILPQVCFPPLMPRSSLSSAFIIIYLIIPVVKRYSFR